MALDHLDVSAVAPWREVLGFALASLVSCVAACSGVGGGGLLVPIYAIIMQRGVHGAAPLSAATILGGAVVNLIANAQRMHPHATRPLIDWDILLTLAPCMMGGAVFGSLINKATEAWLTALGMVLMFGWAAHTGFRKGTQLLRRAQEEKQMIQQHEGGEEERDGGEVGGEHRHQRYQQHEEEEEEDDDDDDPTSSPARMMLVPAATAEQQTDDIRSGSNAQSLERSLSLLHESSWAQVNECVNKGKEKKKNGDDDDDASLPSPCADHDVVVGTLASSESARFVNATTAGNYELAQILTDEQKTPTWKVVWLCALQALVLIATNLRSHPEIGTACGSLAYWLLTTALPVCLVLAALVYFRCLVRPLRIRMANCSYPQVPGDEARPLSWRTRLFLKLAPTAFSAGMLAAWFGTGGASLLSPVMLLLGVQPEVCAATCATLVFFTSMSSTVTFGSQHQIEYGLATVAAVVGAASVKLGRTIVYGLLEKMEGAHRNPHVFVFLFAFINATSSAVMTGFLVEEVISKATGPRASDWRSWLRFKDVCRQD